MLECLRAVMLTNLQDSQICDKIEYHYLPLMLTQNVTIEYDIGDKWFVLTVTFGTIDAVLVVLAIAFGYYYKKSKEEHFEFRKRKEKWLQYDTVYKQRPVPGSNSSGNSPEKEEEEIREPTEPIILKTPSEFTQSPPNE